MRVYLPATLATLARLREQGQLSTDRAYAVTPALREWYAGADDEELAYTAYRHAAQDALHLLRADPAAARRRVVIAADAPATPSAATGERIPGAVALPAPVPRTAVAALHIDGAGAEPAVSAAVAALTESGESGDARAARALAALDDHELEWFDPSEWDELPV